MKKLIFLSALITSSFFVKTADAQIGVHFNINLGPRPVYAPVPPPPVVDDYYYLPDAEAYYSVPEHVYYYQNEGRWISSPRLAGRFYDYDYSRMRHYAINAPRPYLRNDYYRSRFSGPQFAARDNRDFGRNQRFDGPQGRENYSRNNYGRNDQHFDQRGQNHDNHSQRDNRGGRY
ncbi:MAG: hypothetical protein EOP42_10875 [Sphingobacteriaceae bacterium]|nr:MAG: hypothetical protein EOP42_10875 [Sphingobacteriaceae bacterium]